MENTDMEIVGQVTPVREWMQKLYDKHGTLTPEIVKEAARPVDSPAHAWVFNVDVAEAAEEFYLSRAHDLIRRVKVKYVTREVQEPRSIRFWHAVPGGDSSPYTYLPLDRLVEQPDQLALAQREAVRRLNDAQRAVEDLDGLTTDTARKTRTRKATTAIREAQEALTAAN